MHSTVLSYIENNKKKFLDELFALLRIPSVSADPKYKKDIQQAAEFLKQRLQELKLTTVELWPTAGNPVVFAEKIVDPKLPTVLVYGHYDVQPPDPLNLWTTPPFEPQIRDNKIYARGAVDDKGQLYMHLKAIEILNSMGELPCNVKFFIEGEEEVGSVNLEACLRKNIDRLRCDAALISDTSMIANDIPAITVGTRGLSYIEVEVTGPNRDLHSGTYGGAVDNPVNVLCEMIASLKDVNKHIVIPGFYDDVVELSAAERAELAKTPFNEVEYKKELGVDATRGEKGFSIIEQTSIRPTLDVNGIWGGYIGEGAKTVLPGKAFAKISMRLVPRQNSEKITALFKKHFESIAPKSVKVEVRPHHGGEPFLTDTNSLAYQAASAAIEKTFGKKPIPDRAGGSIPILSIFQDALRCPILLLGFGLDTDALHSPNEHFGVFNFLKGIETITLFYPEFAKRSGRKEK